MIASNYNSYKNGHSTLVHLTETCHLQSVRYNAFSQLVTKRVNYKHLFIADIYWFPISDTQCLEER